MFIILCLKGGRHGDEGSGCQIKKTKCLLQHAGVSGRHRWLSDQEEKRECLEQDFLKAFFSLSRYLRMTIFEQKT